MFTSQNKTFREIQNDLDVNLFSIDKKFKEKKFDITDIGDFLPVGLLINHKDGSNVYMNRMSEQTLNFSTDDLKELGSDYTSKICYDADEMRKLKKLINGFYERNDESEILSFFQKVRPFGSDEYEWMFITSKLFKRDREAPPKERLLVACPIKFMGNLSKKINRVLDENHYMKKNFKKFALLTKREKEVLMLLAQGQNNPAIADMLFISRYTVEQHRKNINSKIECKNFSELIRFAMAFDLIY